MTNLISDVLGFLDEKRSKITPEYVRAGKPVYTLRKYAELTDLDAEVLVNGGSMNVSQKVPIIGASGNMLRTPRTSYAVNVDIAFDNRVKVSTQKNEDGTEEKVYTFVVDQRALMEQSSGHIYANFVVGYVIGKDASKKSKPEVRGVVHIKEDEFINDFDTTFDTSAMEEIMDIINKYRVEHGTAKVISNIEF
nr:MAG TPA: hypothetical protein [Caudoviricetes sp.]